MESFLEKYYDKSTPIIIGCSTWPDSMYLLEKILETRFSKNIVACYFNHKTRKQTDEEEEYLIQLWKERNFKVEIAQCDFKKIQKLYPGKSFEELAREKRYAFFNAIMNIYKSPYVLTAHHLDDKIETLFFHLARGTKIGWMINMQEESGNILRPLLWVSKSDILDYLQKNNIKYFIDETNNSNEYTRNYIRNQILPQFENVNSQYRENIAKTLEYLWEVKHFIDESVETFLGEKKHFYIDRFQSLSWFLQKEVVRYIYYITNQKSTLWLSEANIKEVIKFINGKNNKTYKEIKGMRMEKDNKIIHFQSVLK